GRGARRWPPGEADGERARARPRPRRTPARRSRRAPARGGSGHATAPRCGRRVGVACPLRSPPRARARTPPHRRRARTGRARCRATRASSAPSCRRRAPSEAAPDPERRASRIDRGGSPRSAASRLLEQPPRGSAGDGTPAGEAVALAMPERDLRFAELPAEERWLTIDLTRKVDQPELDVLQLGARALDLVHDRGELLDERARRRTAPDEVLGGERLALDAGLRHEAAALGIQPERAALEALDEHREARDLLVRLLQREEFRLRHGADTSR